HIGAASCGTYGTPAGICAAAERFGTVPLADLVAPAAVLAREGVVINPPQADTLERLGAEGAAPFYEGDLAAAISDYVCAQGGVLTHADLAAYGAEPREPVHVHYRGRDVLTNPPPSAGGTLLAYALALLERTDGPPASLALVQAMERAQAERTPEFLTGLPEPGFLARFMASRLGSTTHISVLDGDGGACAVTCTNGEGSGIVVPGTGVHVNNMLGEQD